MGKHGRTAAVIAGLATLYFLTGKLGLMLAFVHPSSTAIWPPSGIALAAVLIFGYEVWPGILLGAFVLNMTTTGTVPVCLGIAVGNTLEALAGAYLVNLRANGKNFIHRTPDVLRFALLAGLFSTAISATFGTTSLSIGGFASWASYSPIWSTWWLGDAVGIVVITPLVLLWVSEPKLRWPWTQILEALALVLCLFAVGLIVFGVVPVEGSGNYPLEYLCVPFLMWAAFRFGPREAATAMLVLSGTAIWGTYLGYGPFSVGTPGASFFLLLAFLGVMAVTTLALAALFAEQRQAELQSRMLAVSDSLTGLGNYRKFIETLEGEIRRSDRTGRSFAFLLMDLDRLKEINDNHGHLVGSRALCRLALILRTHCRSIDVAVRYGGDEFALIMPEADDKAANHVAQRISEWLAADHEVPELSVSIGAAVWPRDGETIEDLVCTADRALYENKRGKNIQQRSSPQRFPQ